MPLNRKSGNDPRMRCILTESGTRLRQHRPRRASKEPILTQTPTLYETLGAETGIRTAVDQFYDRVVADPRLAAYFQGVDMIGLRRHQVAMLSAATGGPKSYTGQEMAAAHAGRAIDNKAFDRVVGHLQETLVSLGVDEQTITTVLGALSPLRSDIVTV